MWKVACQFFIFHIIICVRHHHDSRSPHPNGSRSLYPNCCSSLYPNCCSSLYPNCCSSLYPNCCSSLCPNCSRSLCPNCSRSLCPNCSRSLCHNCSRSLCHNCSRSLCHNCSRSLCHNCSRSLCPNCSRSLCPNCSRSLCPNCSRSLFFKLVEPAPRFDFTFGVLLLARVNWRGVHESLSSIEFCPFFSSHSTIYDLDNQLSKGLLQFVPMVTVWRRSGDSPRFHDECRTAFDRKSTAYRRLSGSLSNVDWDQFVSALSEAEACYASAKVRYSEQCVAKIDACMHVSPSHWWRALKGPVFESSTSRNLVFIPVCKAELLSSWFDSKQSHEAGCWTANNLSSLA